MTPEVWVRVKTILGEALDLAPGERAAYLDTACAGDGSLPTEREWLRRPGGEQRVGILRLPPRTPAAGTRIPGAPIPGRRSRRRIRASLGARTGRHGNG